MPYSPPSSHAALASCRGWLISDGRAGNDAQSRGVLDALGVAYEVKRIAPAGIWRHLAPYGRVSASERLGQQGSTFAEPWPDFAIGAGRQVTPYLRAIRKRAGIGTYTVQLLDPRCGTGSADLYWVPVHDRLRGPNVITSITAPHSFSPEALAAARADPPAWRDNVARPRVAVLLGGPSRAYRYDQATVCSLTTTLHSLIVLGAGLMVTPSRRTPPVLVEAIAELTAHGPHHLWDGGGENPLRHYLAQAEAIVVTADSTNMVGEACVTGKPVYVFAPSGGSAKIARFHEALAAHGATRPCPTAFARLDEWHYPPLFSARAIAGEIVARWERRRAMLSGLVA